MNMPSFIKPKIPLAFLVAMFFLAGFSGEVRADVVEENEAARFGILKGVVRDRGGKPIARATVSIFRAGSSKLIKRVKSTNTGRFFTKIIPGTYKVLAVAQGFSPETLKSVKVENSTASVYGFRLKKAGSGRTLPEKKADRNSSKWRIRAAKRRSIYQNNNADKELIDSVETAVAEDDEYVSEVIPPYASSEEIKKDNLQTVVEGYAGVRAGKAFVGTNFATVQPLGKDAQIIYAGQVGAGKDGAKRFETAFAFRPNSKHELNLKGSLVGIGQLKEKGYLAQASVQALDKWRLKQGVILVLGIDYSRFVGSGNDSSINPRIGFQMDVDSKTRVRSSYTTQTEPMNWQRAIDMEDTQVLFRDPVAVEDIAFKNDKPQMMKTRRLEFGVERILDNRSSVEANVFFDSVIGKGVGLASLPFDSLNAVQFNKLVATQEGNARGLRVVYSRRINGTFGTSVGYSFGNGQKLSDKVLKDPADAFTEHFFQTLFAELSATFASGTRIKAVYRLSPKATIFAIDPFRGRLAIYDPGLSILVTQDLPVWGLPIDAEAVFDAKNLFDVNTGVDTREGTLLVNSQRRTLRGGILVRF